MALPLITTPLRLPWYNDGRHLWIYEADVEAHGLARTITGLVRAATSDEARRRAACAFDPRGLDVRALRVRCPALASTGGGSSPHG